MRSTRWWPRYSDVLSYEIEQVGRYLILWVVDNNRNKYFIPLKELDRHKCTLTQHIKPIDIGQIMYVEADLVEPFLLLAKDELRCEHIASLPSANFTSIKLLSDSTNITVVAYLDSGGGIVLKRYRLGLSQRDEVEILRYLTFVRFNHIPKLYSICRHRDVYVGVVLEYVEGVDGGFPFYNSLLSMLTRNTYNNVISLGHSIGETVAQLHLALSLLGIKTFDLEDVDLWIKRTEFMMKELLTKIDHLHSEQAVEGSWIELADKRAHVWFEQAVNAFNTVYGLKKIVCHQDLHLGQTVYSKNRGFVITDFEGEPLSLSIGIGKVSESHVFRDIAALIRSLDYIVFTAVHNALGIDIDSTARRLVRTRWGDAKAWRNIHAEAIIGGYINGLGDQILRITGLASIDKDVYKYITPWYIYRVFYEALYEAFYRPSNLPIPLHILAWDPEDLVRGLGVAR